MTYKISDSEWKIMEILWEKEEAVQSEIMDALDVKWNKNTVYTFLSRLENKGLIDAEGSPKQYRAAVSREECVSQEEENFLNKVYRGSAGKMVAAFVEEGRLTPAEMEELKRLLEGMNV
ncbi:MAG: BlaI/MecI/CopY family transcriptional regulator [Anaerotignum sp.]|nr:BlaI/MecI/CopY family transcriptional regulator [Anaerotignum sp.]MBR2383548.1 BlaI/MecI/CopY family transcriptional regulator [Anaerotignum sp.]MBR3909795.1 BlaI/MecI/CopY family transcriptional regulator [Anaerotignum sp.]MBR4113908.1 BlaI/MecI/CopY family transcriptional regulator [Anaerotignum sp.]